jgi:hypothetical protein
MTEDSVRRERRDAPIPGADFPGLEEGTRSSFTKVPAKAVEVNELGERGVHKMILTFPILGFSEHSWAFPAYTP